MKRRQVLSGTLLYSAYMATGAIDAQTSAPSLPANSFLGSPGDSIQDLVLANGTIYALTKQPRAWQFTAMAFSLEGEGHVLWQHALPPAGYQSLGVHPDGSLLLSAIGLLKTQAHHILHLNTKTGQVDIVAEVTAGPAFRNAGGGVMARITTQGSLEVFNAVGESPRSIRLAVLAGTLSNAAYIQPFDGSSRIALVDPGTGAVSRVDLNTGTVEGVSNSTPELERSKAFYEPIVRNHPSDKPPLQPLVVTAVGGDGQRRMSMLLSPYTTDGVANLLSLSDTGNEVGVTHVVLPHRQSVGNPCKLGMVDNRRVILFSQGFYVLYPA